MKQNFEREYSVSSRLSVHHSLEYRTRLILPDELDPLCRINHELLFSRSQFSASLHAIRERNLSIFEVNALSFAVVEAKVHDAFVPVGMCSILPLNRYGESIYCLTGGLKDIELRGHHIAAPGEWSNAVLIFIVGFTREVRRLLRARPLTAIANVVFDHGSHVISSMRVRHPERRNVRLLAQTNRSNGGINSLFQYGGSNTGIITGDGYLLQELILEVPTQIPDRDNLSGAFLSSCERITNARSSADVGA
ncbi:hypothetical protein AB0E01_00020 [Nocardia vinacea]|uniref:hypothetical protein n=1 Tax=Nocardia vinacea TaxID=96468 RepID=UPI0033F58B3A